MPHSGIENDALIIFCSYCCWTETIYHKKEIPENGADVAHLNVVHKPAMLTGGKPNDAVLKWSFLKHVWGASWAANEQSGEEYKALMKVHHHMSIFNKISLMSMDVEAHQV